MNTPATLPPSLTVAEVFGPTVQGEGPSMGRRCSFIRLGGCNLTCTWCDTPYTWDASRFDLRQQMSRWTVEEILEKALIGDPDRVVISGGEPLLQQGQEGWGLLLDALYSRNIDVEVETNGTQAPNPLSLIYIQQFNVSPKLGHGGDLENKRIVPKALEAFNTCGKAEFKFVCKTADDVDEVARIAADHNIPSRKVWIMPEGTSSQKIAAGLSEIAGLAISHGFNITTRLHVTIWGDERRR